MNDSYIKIYRGLSDWEWYKDSKMVHIFIHLLLNANFVDGRFKGQIVKRGQLITGRNSIAQNTGITTQSVRTCLERLKSTNEITIQSTNEYSLITIVKYDVYQQFEKKSTNKSANKLTNDKPTSNQQVTTIEEGNKGRNKIYFKDSIIFDKKEFKNSFPEWTKEKLSYYYETALTWSNEGNKKIDWVATVKNWASRDEKQGKLKFDIKQPFVNLGGIV